MKKIYTAQEVRGFNQKYQENFQKSEIKDRLVFLSHCLKPALIEEITSLALSLGYQKEHIFIVGGFTAVEEKLKEFKNPPFIGIACPREIIQGRESLNETNNINAQAAALTFFRCPFIKLGQAVEGESEVDVEEAKRILSL